MPGWYDDGSEEEYQMQQAARRAEKAKEPASPAGRPAHTPQAWEKELFGYIWVTNGQLLCNPEKLAEIVEKIRNEGRDSVLYIRCLKHQGGPQYNKDEHGQECAECAVQAACNNYEALKAANTKAMELLDRMANGGLATASQAMGEARIFLANAKALEGK